LEEEEREDNWSDNNVVSEKVTIFDLDTRVNSSQESALCDITNNNQHSIPIIINNRPSVDIINELKRKRSREEVEEAVSSIMLKRSKHDDFNYEDDDDLDFFSDENPIIMHHHDDDDLNASDSSVQSLTNLVSIFSFRSQSYLNCPPLVDDQDQDGGLHVQQQLTRSASSPDLCSSQLYRRSERRQQTEHVRRSAIAMTV
jgi:hypothetical protein